MKTYLWLLFHFLLVPPFSSFFSPLMYRSPTFSLSSPLIYLAPFSSLSPLSSPFYPSLAPLSFLFYLFLYSVIYLLLCVWALQSRQSQWCPSRQHRSGNESLPPSGAHWHGGLLSPSSVGAGQSEMGIGQCRSRLVWWHHHKGTSSACTVGWHAAHCSTVGAGPQRVYTILCGPRTILRNLKIYFLIFLKCTQFDLIPNKPDYLI